MLGCKPTKVLTDPNHKISLVEWDKSVDKETYQRLVG